MGLNTWKRLSRGAVIGRGHIGCVAFRSKTRTRTMLGSIGVGNLRMWGRGLGGSSEQVVGILGVAEVSGGARKANSSHGKHSIGGSSGYEVDPEAPLASLEQS